MIWPYAGLRVLHCVLASFGEEKGKKSSLVSQFFFFFSLQISFTFVSAEMIFSDFSLSLKTKTRERFDSVAHSHNFFPVTGRFAKKM